MESQNRVRRAVELVSVWTPSVVECDDNESESENEDFVEPECAHESEEDVDANEDQMEVDIEESGRVTQRQEVAATHSSYSTLRDSGHESYLHSKSGFKWSRNPPESRGERSKTQYIATPTDKALNVTTPIEAWSLLFSDEILKIVVNHKNDEITRTIEKIKTNGEHVASYQKPVDLIELKAVIGLLYFSGMNKVSHSNTRNLWSPYGMSLFRLTMAENRFKFLALSMRFDDKNTRAERKVTDRLANIRVIWDMFIANCMAYYNPHTNCTIDEQLLSFRGRCLFRMHMPTKPNKYGLKIVSLNDATTHYMYNAMPYIGLIDKDPDEAVPSYYVRKLTEPIYHSGRNITCDDRFTSIPICDKMMKDYNLTMVGMIRKKEYEIPEQFKKLPPSGKNAQFAYNDRKTLVSYNPTRKKIVLLLSSLHTNGKIDEAISKPEIVDFYNDTKGGTDSFAQKCHNYTTARKTRRWPLRYFYGMLDQANVNSLIIYTLCANNAIMKQTDFILDLTLALVNPFLSKRLTLPTLRLNLRFQIEGLVNNRDVPENQDPRNLMAENKMAKQKRCGYCPSILDRKTYYKCLCCERPMCREHIAKVCCNCSIDMSKFNQ